MPNVIKPLCDVLPREKIKIYGYKKTYKGLVVARVNAAKYKSYIHISFVGGIDYQLPRTSEVEVLQ